MSKPQDFLVEIGTEEMPPKALLPLMEAFGEFLADGIDDARLGRGEVHAYASPRRLAVLVQGLAMAQDDRADDLTVQFFRSVTAQQDTLGLDVAVALFYVGRFLERIADHGVVIAENVTFAVSGESPGTT